MYGKYKMSMVDKVSMIQKHLYQKITTKTAETSVQRENNKELHTD